MMLHTSPLDTEVDERFDRPAQAGLGRLEVAWVPRKSSRQSSGSERTAHVRGDRADGRDAVGLG